LASVEALIERPWLDFVKLLPWNYQIQPHNNQHNYGREIGRDQSMVACMLLLDPATVGDKTRLARLLVQQGIDYYHLLLNGMEWRAEGGHFQGRKFQILFAGLMLNHSGMLGIGSYPITTFQEDGQCFYITADDVALDIVLHQPGIVSGASASAVSLPNMNGYAWLADNYIDITSGTGSGQRRYISSTNQVWGNTTTVVCQITPNWDVTPVNGDSHFRIVGYEAAQIGLPEWTGEHSTRWGNNLWMNPSWHQPYRECCTAASWGGYVLAARLLSLQTTWNNPAFFDYQDRYMANPLTETGFRAIDPFVENMWDAYRGGE
jgi:hypothetical protein